MPEPLSLEVTLQLLRADTSEDYATAKDISNVFWTHNGELQPGLKFYYVHITDVPIELEAKAANIRAMLMEWDTHPTGEFDPDTGDALEYFRNYTRWCFTADAMPLAQQTELIENAEIRGTWDDLRQYVCQKLDRILPGEAYDPTKYAPITDEELLNA